MAARAAIFNLMLLTGAVAPAATGSLTHCFLARFLLDVIALCVTLGSSCSCTLGASCVSRVIERVCLSFLGLLPSLALFVVLRYCRWAEMAPRATVSGCCCCVSLLVAQLPLELHRVPLFCL